MYEISSTIWIKPFLEAYYKVQQEMIDYNIFRAILEVQSVREGFQLKQRGKFIRFDTGTTPFLTYHAALGGTPFLCVHYFYGEREKAERFD